MKKRTKIILIIILAIIAVSVTGFVILVNRLESNLEKLMALDIQNIDVSSVPDGKYTGSYSVFPVSAEVEVTVSNNEIENIDLIKHTHGRGEAAEVIPEKVVEAQSLKIDVITSATYSSKVILKAIEDALLNATE
ncbi:MAG: FMN-binding protein [Thermotogota bacterium]|nr:FMN-binding protein [Thermotogota bacterium]